jgi:hypothetical protein
MKNKYGKNATTQKCTLPVIEKCKTNYLLIDKNIRIMGGKTNDLNFLLTNKNIVLSQNFLKILNECKNTTTFDNYLNEFLLDAVYKNYDQAKKDLRELKQKMLIACASTIVKCVAQLIIKGKAEKLHLIIGVLNSNDEMNGYIIETCPTQDEKVEVLAKKSPEWQHYKEPGKVDGTHIFSVDE